jgi:copper(I)-binding protein
MDLSKTPIKPGDTVPLTLLFQTADGKTVRQTVSASVKPLTGRDSRPAGADGGHKHH